MADLTIKAGATSQSINIDLYVLATGAPQTGLVFNSLALTCYYSFTGANATANVVSLATLAAVNSAWSSGGFKEIDATHMPGLYRFDIPDLALAAAKGMDVVITFTGFSGMRVDHTKIELTGWDNQNAVTGGMSALASTPLTAAQIATGVWQDTTAGDFTVVGSVGKQLETNLDATVSSRSTFAGGAVASVTGNVGGNVVGNVNGNVVGSVGSVTGLTASDVGAIKAKTDNLPALPASTTNITGGTITTVTNLTNSATAGDLTAAMKTSVQVAADAAITANAAIIEIAADTDTLITGVNITSIAGSAPAAVDLRDDVLTNTPTIYLGTIPIA